MFSPVMEQSLALGLLLTTFALVSAVGLFLDQAVDYQPADRPRQDLLMEVCRRLQFTEGYRMCGIADSPADGGFSVGQLYTVSVCALVGPARYFQGSLK
jgi:hypothetical protein